MNGVKSRALIVAALGALAAGCGGSGTTTTVTRTTTPSTTAAPAASSPTSCLVAFERVNIVFKSDTVNVAPRCQQWAKEHGAEGQYWATLPATDAPTETTANFTCDLKDPSGQMTADVLDPTTDQTVGNKACAELVADGWTQQ